MSISIKEAGEALSKALSITGSFDTFTAMRTAIASKYGEFLVGSEYHKAGLEKELYFLGGNVATLARDEDDLSVCIARLKSKYEEMYKTNSPIILMSKYDYHRQRGEIERALESVLESKRTVGGSLEGVTDVYPITYNPETRDQTREPKQILDGLLTGDAKELKKAVTALRVILG